MFIDMEFDICPGYGWQGGPAFSTRIISLRNWRERRNAQNILVRHSYTLPILNISDPDYLMRIKGVFLSTMGMTHSFKVKDYSDFSATDELFAIGDGVTKDFQLMVQSTFGTAFYQRIITKPSNGVSIKVNGSVTAATVNALTGIVSFSSAPAEDSILRWTGEFRVPVRFNNDVLVTTIDNKIKGSNYAMNGSIDLIEVFE